MAASLTGCATIAGNAAGRRAYVFAYFKNIDNGSAGLRLALSHDGRTFEPLFGGRPLLRPTIGKDRLLRDPCVFPDPDGGYHLVWTTGWSGTTIGHAQSMDLVHWRSQQAIEVMREYPGTRNCWAPEGMWDPRAKCFVLFWASTVDGAFVETNTSSLKPRNHRIYYTTTRDFHRFTPSRLLYQPGFNVIDATFLSRSERLFMFVKDETSVPVRKSIQWCEAASPLGPFGPLSPAITPPWTEGPTAYQVEGEVIVLFDRYRENRYGAVASRDMLTWHDISSEIVIPTGASHGTVVTVSDSESETLKSLLQGY